MVCLSFENSTVYAALGILEDFCSARRANGWHFNYINVKFMKQMPSILQPLYVYLIAINTGI